MKRSALRLASSVLIVTAVGTVIWVNAGDLNPPGGAVAPTMKPLTDIEPRTAINATNTPGDADSVYRITQGGSYYLTDNLTGVGGKSGIEIAADGVSIDLKGFTVGGVATTLAAITTGGLSRVRIEVRNGAVAAFIAGGIDLAGTGAIVSDVRVRVCGGPGIKVGEGALVRDCTSSGNQSNGITCGAGCVIERCTVRSNLAYGIQTGVGATVRACSANSNGQAGIFTDDGSSVSGCRASNNTDFGILTNSGNTITDCAAFDNAGNGILTSAGCSVSHCEAYLNTTDGINAFDGSTVSACAAYQNGGRGIRVYIGCTVVDCSTKFNTLDGIECDSECLIRGNMCTRDGEVGSGAAIHANNGRNRIEGNNCSLADRGIDVDSAGNIIIRNTCSANTTDWTIAANNIFGPIIDRRSVSIAAVSGFSATSSLGSTDANANYSY